MLESGSIQCWGSNGCGQFGDGTTTDSLVPVTVPGISTAIAVDADGQHTCAVLSNGSIQCWGFVDYGSSCPATGAFVPPPLNTVSGISNATGVTVGIRHTCALLSTGSVQCWGFNDLGQLGADVGFDYWDPVTVDGV